jgi:hypothetical protein
MSRARGECASLAGVRDSLAQAVDLFGVGREADEPRLLGLLEAVHGEIADATALHTGPVSRFSAEWIALTAAQIEHLRESNRPTRVELGAALLSLEFLLGVIDLQLARDGLPDHCVSCDSPQLAAIPEETAVFECLACGLRTAYPA